MADQTDLMFTYAGRATIGFIKLRESATLSDKQHAFCYGSGVAVRLGRICGVLTCAHVAKAVMEEPVIGLLQFPTRQQRFQNLRVETDKLGDVIWQGSKWGAARPDMAFLRLPEVTFAEISAKSLVIDLDVQAAQVAQDEPRPCKRFDVVSGVVDSMTEAPRAEGSQSTTVFTSLHHVGHLRRPRALGDYDIWKFRADPGPDFQAPSSYAGMSGGPIWRFYFKPDGEEPDSAEFIGRRLVGIAFWQYLKTGTLVGHAARTLYAGFVPRIRSKWG